MAKQLTASEIKKLKSDKQKVLTTNNVVKK